MGYSFIKGFRSLGKGLVLDHRVDDLVWGLKFMVGGVGFGVWDLGFRDLGFGVWDSWLGV